VDITPCPSRPLPLAGYSERTEPFAGVADPLEANVLVCRDQEQTLVLVTFDLLYVGELLRHKLQEALAPEVQPEQLFLTASHTHFAPATDPTLPQLGSVDEGYVDWVASRVADLVRRLLRARPQPLRVGTGQCPTHLSVNRRLAAWQIRRRFPFLRKSVVMAPNFAGPVERLVRVARIGPDVVLWCFACHPVILPRMDQVSADFVGFVRAALRRDLGAGTTVLFWQGFSGNIYPSYVRSSATLAGRLRLKLLGRAETVRPSAWQRWATGLADQVVAAAQSIPAQEAVCSLAWRRGEIPWEALMPGCGTGKSFRAHVLDLGEALRIVGVSAEMVVEYLPLFQSLFGPRPLFCVSCLDGVAGYVPTSVMLAEGGYEADGFRSAFGLTGEFHPHPEQFLGDRLLQPLAG
jgi:hypothetical protein